MFERPIIVDGWLKTVLGYKKPCLLLLYKWLLFTNVYFTTRPINITCTLQLVPYLILFLFN